MAQTKKQDANFRRFLPAGGHGLVVNFDDGGDKPTHRARALAQRIEGESLTESLTGIVDLIPGLTNLLVQYDPLKLRGAELEARITPWLEDLDTTGQTARQLRIPCCYDAEFALDLAEIAETLRLDAEDIIARHIGAELEVAIMGFMPGLGYMKGVDASLHLPRRATPRAKVPARTLGIAMDQSVIYPLTSPGGWNLIGRVPMAIFDITKPDPVLLRTGDKIKFYRIDKKEYNEIRFAYKSGAFQVEIITP